MAITLITSASAANGTSSAVDTTGATAIFIVQAWTSVDTPPLDNQTNAYYRVQRGNFPVNATCDLYVCLSPTTSATHTFSTGPGSGFETISVAVFGGANLTGLRGANNGSGAGTASTLTTGSFTPLASGAVLVAGLAYRTESVTASIDSSFTVAAQRPYVSGVQIGSAIAYLVQGSVAAVNPQWSWTGASGCNATISAAYEAAAGGGGGGAFTFVG